MVTKCRICLLKVEDSNYLNIFSRTQSGELLSEVLMNLAPIQIIEDDNLPNLICSICETKINYFLEFRTLIINSDIELRMEHKLNINGNFDNPELLVDIKIEDNINDDIHDESQNNFELVNVSKELKVCNDSDIGLEASASQDSDAGIKPEVKQTEVKIKKKRDRKKHLKLFFCAECNEGFRYKSTLLAHSRKHTGDWPFVCEICKKGFSAPHILRVHQVTHSQEKTYKCKDCGESYKSYSSLYGHTKAKHSNEIHTCTFCSKTFTRVPALKTHELIHKGSGRKYICEHCGLIRTELSSFLRHLKSHTEEPLVDCTVCGKSFKKSSLRQHLKLHTGEKPFSCEVCGRKFGHKPVLKNHMRIHDGLKPFTCTICQKSFSQKSILGRHMRVHTGETPFHCSLCGKQFPYSHHLLKHVQKEHPEANANE